MADVALHFKTAEELPAPLADALLSWILSVADTKHTLGLQFSHWVTGTPALEAAVGSAAIAQDELGHARSLHAILRNYPGAPEGLGAENDLEARAVYYVPAALVPRWESWRQVIAANVILDRALATALAATADSAFAPLAGRTAKILQEERFHRVFGDNWLGRLSARDAATRARLQEAIDWAWPIAGQWLGPESDPIVSRLHDAGILSVGVSEMRRQWLARVEPVLVANGLNIPADEMDWSGWGAKFRHIDHA